MAFAWTWDSPALSLAQFEAYLRTITPPTWAIGVTIHHTASPTLPQWRGVASMNSLGVFYRDTRGWGAGPHAFITDKAIHVGTPFNQLGVHAGACNSNRVGFEVVGNYNSAFWSDGTRRMVLGAAAAVYRWIQRNTSTLNCHGIHCMPGTECPGDTVKAQFENIRGDVARLLAAAKEEQVTTPIGAKPATGTYVLKTALRVRSSQFVKDDNIVATFSPDTPSERALTITDVVVGTAVAADGITTNWWLKYTTPWGDRFLTSHPSYVSYQAPVVVPPPAPAAPAPLADRQVYKIPATMTEAQWLAFLQRTTANLNDDDARYLYGTFRRLLVDPAFYGALAIVLTDRKLGTVDLLWWLDLITDVTVEHLRAGRLTVRHVMAAYRPEPQFASWPDVILEHMRFMEAA